MQGNSKYKSSISNHRKRINYSTSGTEIISCLFAKHTKLKAIKSLLHTSHKHTQKCPRVPYKQDELHNLWGQEQSTRQDSQGGNSRELTQGGEEMGGAPEHKEGYV